MAAILRTAGILAGGGAFYHYCDVERLKASDFTRLLSTIKSQPVVISMPVAGKENAYIKTIASIAVVGTSIWWFKKTEYVSTRNFKRACESIQSGVTSVAKTVLDFKDSAMKRFVTIERKIDAVDKNINKKASEIRRDLSNVELSITDLKTQVDRIDQNTTFSSTVLGNTVLGQEWYCDPPVHLAAALAAKPGLLK